MLPYAPRLPRRHSLHVASSIVRCTSSTVTSHTGQPEKHAVDRHLRPPPPPCQTWGDLVWATTTTMMAMATRRVTARRDTTTTMMAAGDDDDDEDDGDGATGDEVNDDGDDDDAVPATSMCRRFGQSHMWLVCTGVLTIPYGWDYVW